MTPTCADVNGDGSAVDAFDCSDEAKELALLPGDIACAGVGCTASECCTACPTCLHGTYGDGAVEGRRALQSTVTMSGGATCAQMAPFCVSASAQYNFEFLEPLSSLVDIFVRRCADVFWEDLHRLSMSIC